MRFLSKEHLLKQRKVKLLDQSRIYPRGFVAKRAHRAIPEETAAELSQEVKVTSAVIATSLDTIASKMVAHPDVEELYYAVTQDPILTREFKVRERILKLAKEVFTDKPGDWVIAQTTSPAFTRNHFEFIQDIVRFAETGRANLSNVTYRSLLKGEVTPRRLEQRADDETVATFVDSKPILQSGSLLITGICKRNSGFLQLLAFLHILVGAAETPEEGISSNNARFII